MEMHLLGPVRAWTRQQPVDLGPRQRRLVFAVLALEANHLVPVERLVELCWPDRDPPPSARRVLHSHLSRLRTALGGPGPAVGGPDDPAGPPRLLRQGPGYLLRCDRLRVDVHLFRDLVDQAHAVAEPERRRHLLNRALDLWRGPALADAAPDELRERLCAGLEEARLAAIEDRTDAELRLGRHLALLDPLTELTGAYPNRPRLAAQLVLALYRAGRTDDALAACRRAGQRLADELGLDPGPRLRELELDILRASPDLDLPPTGAAGLAALAAAAAVPPAQLPPPVAHFTGRARELAWLSEAGAGPGETGPRLLTGMAGAGKTALAVHWGHQVADQFPDGQLYLDLRGYAAGRPTRPGDALGQLLRALGVEPARIPLDPAEAAATYRTALAGKRVLILLDNAMDTEQVRPLLPGRPGCVVLVTSRDQLRGLVARDGARRLAVGGLLPADAIGLAARLVRPAHPLPRPAAAQLARLCGYLPLALRIAAANLVEHGQPVAAYLTELRDGHRLPALSVQRDSGAAVEAAFDLSYAGLTVHSRQMFRWLSLVPGPDVSLAAASALAGIPEAAARPRLDQLVSAHLLEEPVPGRYRFHDLLRLYAQQRTETEDDPYVRKLARRRLFGWYLGRTDAAARLLYPHVLRLPAAGPRPTRPVADFADPVAALSFVDGERANLIAAILDPAEPPWPSANWLLADALRGYLQQRRYPADAVSVAGAALRRATDARRPHPEALARLGLALGYDGLGRDGDALREGAAARDAARRAGWPDAEAAALTNLGNTHWRRGEIRESTGRYREAVAMYQRTGWSNGLATTLANLSMAYRALGDLRAAQHSAQRALALYRAVGSAGGEAIALDNLGALARQEGDLRTAFARLRRALMLFRKVGNRYGEALALNSLALAHRDAGAHREALAHAHECLLVAREIGEKRTETDALNALASIHLAGGLYRYAIDRYTEAARLARRIGNRYPEAEALIGLARSLTASGDPEPALGPARRALAVARQGGYRTLELEAAAVLAGPIPVGGSPRPGLATVD